MKVLRGVLILLLLLAIAYLIWMFFLPARLYLEKSVTVQAPQEEVYQELSNFRNWEPWSPWEMRDTSVSYTYLETTSAPDGAYQFRYGRWAGKQAFTSHSAPDSLRTSIKFRGLQPGVSRWALDRTDSGTTIQWQLMAHYGYLERVIGVFMGRQMDRFYGDALAALKRHLEGTELAFPVKQTRMPAISYLAVRDTLPTKEITNEYMAQRFLEVLDFIDGDYDTSYYAPMALYHRWGKAQKPAALSVALPHKDAEGGNERIRPGKTIDQPALEVLYRGPYPERDEAYRSLKKYARQNDLRLKGPLLELYVSNPQKQAAPEQQVTRMVQAYETDSIP